MKKFYYLAIFVLASVGNFGYCQSPSHPAPKEVHSQVTNSLTQTEVNANTTTFNPAIPQPPDHTKEQPTLQVQWPHSRQQQILDYRFHQYMEDAKIQNLEGFEREHPAQEVPSSHFGKTSSWTVHTNSGQFGGNPYSNL